MTKHRPNFEHARIQVQAYLPDEVKGTILNAIDICSKKVEVVKNGCETAYKWVNFECTSEM